MSALRHALVVGSAPAPDEEGWYAEAVLAADFLIAADGGLELCLAAGRVPDVCVGDFDSVSADALSRAQQLGARVRRYPTAKDESDLDLAVTVARQAGAERLTLTAAFTGRVDHTLASLGTLLRAADLHARAVEPEWRGYALDADSRSSIVLMEPPGIVFSVMAPAGVALVSISGVAYPLSRHELPAMSSLGLSNVATLERQEVTVHAGSALVIVNRSVSGFPLS